MGVKGVGSFCHDGDETDVVQDAVTSGELADHGKDVLVEVMDHATLVSGR